MMLNYYYYIMFFPIMLLSNLMMLISNSWFSMWMIMEINLISFICLIMFDKMMKLENLMNYFLFQVLNSYMYFFFMILMNFISIDLNNLFIIILMLNKLGFPPFIQWYLKILLNMNWMNLFIMMTFQKIIPLIIINNSMIMDYSYIKMLIFLLLIYMFYSSIMGMNQSNIKIILGYSSIIQMSWIIILMNFNESYSLNYYIIYFFIMMSVIYIFYKYNMNNLILSMMNNTKFNYLFMFSIMSLASLPPFFGFLMKWMSIQLLFNKISLFFLIIMIYISLLSMMFYLRILHLIMLYYSIYLKLSFKDLNFNHKNNYMIIFMNWFMIFMLLMYEMI
nr:NADH dehydrogenase subunit 2 [Pachycrepoideus vindemmiae]